MQNQFAADESTYDIKKSYKDNYNNGPHFLGEIPQRPIVKEKFKFLGFDVNSRLGVPAGPLLNSEYTSLYAKLGFDIVTYKTVRTITRQAHPVPNCVYVDTKGQLMPNDAGKDIVETGHMPTKLSDITITNSFGMPCATPEEWMRDIEKANSELDSGQLLIVSIVGSPGESIDIIQDFAKCARMAKEAGAKVIEANYSCPNVCTGEGSIYMDPEASSQISKAIKKEIGDTPLIIKIGYFEDQDELEEVIKANMPYVQCFSGINTIAMNVYNQEGGQALPGEGRLKSGLCGAGINDVSLDFTKKLALAKKTLGGEFEICSVGGITKPEQFDERFTAGANAAMSATGAMWDPFLAHKYHLLHAND